MLTPLLTLLKDCPVSFGRPLLMITIPRLKRSVYDTLVAQDKLRDKLRGPIYFNDVDTDYRAAKRTLKRTDVGRRLSIISSVHDADGKEVVNDKGQVIATLTNDSWSTKRDIALALAKRLSEESGEDIRVMDIELHSILATEALRQGNMAAFALLDDTACVGTPMLHIGNWALCSFGEVDECHRDVRSYLHDDYSYPSSRYASRLVLVGPKAWALSL